jgi:hypothetical protein
MPTVFLIVKNGLSTARGQRQILPATLARSDRFFGFIGSVQPVSEALRFRNPGRSGPEERSAAQASA